LGRTATVTAAIAATRTIAKKEEVSTSITQGRSYVRPSGTTSVLSLGT
jgi:hypothetical protein